MSVYYTGIPNIRRRYICKIITFVILFRFHRNVYGLVESCDL